MTAAEAEGVGAARRIAPGPLQAKYYYAPRTGEALDK